MARSRQSQPKGSASANPAGWPLPLDARRPWHTWYGDGFAVVAYADTESVTFAGGRYELPREFDALFDRDGMPISQLRIRIEDSRPVCVQVAIGRREGESPLTSLDIRLPLSDLVREATRQVGGTVATGETVGSFGIAADERAEFDAAFATESPRPQRGRRTPDEFLKRVADAYRIALAQGDPPTQAVARALNGSRSSAGRWVVEARRRGFLGGTTAGRAGEDTQKGRKHGKRR